jgi:hypothetical protein
MNINVVAIAGNARTVQLSGPKLQALSIAARDAVCEHGSTSRRGVGTAKAQTLKSLERAGLLRVRDGGYPKEWVPTEMGKAAAERAGLDTRFAGVVPSRRARAFMLRGLTMPDVWASGEHDAHMPRRLAATASRHARWIEELGYGKFEVVSHPTYSDYSVLNLTGKGRKLVEATDTPVTLWLAQEEEENLREGRMKYGIVPDPCVATLANFQIVSSDSIESPRALYARLYDPGALFPGTRLRLARASDGCRIGEARAGGWNRIHLSLMQAYARGRKNVDWHFDATFEYPDEVAHDQDDRRVWAPFPEDYENQSVRPREAALQFAHDCGFNSLRSMRAMWLKRAEQGAGRAGSEMRGWIKGIIVELGDVRLTSGIE